MIAREIRIAINGFGRIGRALTRALQNHPSLKIALINDPMPADQAAYLLKYDSVMGKLFGSVEVKKNGLSVLGHEIEMTHETSVADVNWKERGIDFVINSSGKRMAREILERYLENGARRVFISAPAPGLADAHVLMGVNNMALDPKARIISGGSCTAHCFAPVMQMLSTDYKIERGFMQTVHAYTSAQNLQDGSHPNDPRRGRAAANNIVPTTTEAIKAFEAAMPAFAGVLKGMAMRVPVANGSNIDLTLQLEREPSGRDEINEYLKLHTEMGMRKIVEYSEDPLVSTDIIGNPHSCVIDSLLTEVHGPLVRLFLWYDNEWGYTSRFAELLELASYLRD